MLSILSRLTGRRPAPDLSHLAFTVYSRQQCCCCHTAIDLLNQFKDRYHFTIETVDVDADPGLAALYGDSVPVVTLGGKVRFRGVVNPALLERLLLAEGRNRAGSLDTSPASR